MFKFLKEILTTAPDTLRAQFALPVDADQNLRKGASARVLIQKLESLLEGPELADAIQNATKQTAFQSPFAFNEFGDCLNRHHFPELALPLFTSSAIEYPRETPDDRNGAVIVQQNLLKSARGINQKAIQLWKQKRRDEATSLFQLVIEHTHSFLSQTGIEDRDILHEKDAAFNWLNTPPPGFRPRSRRKNLH